MSGELDRAQPGLPDGARHEVKAVVDELEAERLLADLELHPAAIRREYPPRQVQSLYFDTPEGRDVDASLDGLGERAKLRLRWYAKDARAVECALERKLRRGRITWKERFAFSAPIEIEGVSHEALRSALLSLVPARWSAFLSGEVRIAQWITYRREYLRTADRRVRITVDRDLRASDQRPLVRLSRRHATPLPRVVILEFKAFAAHEQDLLAFLRPLRLTLERCSKLVLATDPEALGPRVLEAR